MPAYAIAHFQDVVMGPQIITYLQGIDATLAPFEGRFLVHGGPAKILEGPWTGDLVVIAFPDWDQASAWYASPAYQAILPLRLRNAKGAVLLVDGVEEAHRATDILAPQPG